MGLSISLNGTLNRKSHLSERGNGLNVQLQAKLNWRSVPQRNWSNRLFSGFTWACLVEPQNSTVLCHLPTKSPKPMIRVSPKSFITLTSFTETKDFPTHSLLGKAVAEFRKNYLKFTKNNSQYIS